MDIGPAFLRILRWPWGHSRAPDLVAVLETEPPLREELFSITQLESHARSLAVSQQLDTRPYPEFLLHRLGENEAVIRSCYEDIAGAVRQAQPVSPVAEWLLDNHYLIAEQIDHIRRNFPPRYSRQLPRLGSGPLKGFPRLYELALDLVSHTDGRVNLENLSRFLQSYQAVHPLKLGELWAVPIMVGLALIENLRRVSYRIAWRRQHQQWALDWSQRFIQVIQQEPRSLITVLADFVRSHPPMAAPFLVELTADLQGRHPTLGLVINWIEQELAERGQTLELIQQAESHDQAVDHVSMGNAIHSLRSLSTIDWRDFIESLSVIEIALRRDPSGVHARMDFHSRDLCRQEVEKLARRSGQDEEIVAEAVVHLATAQTLRPDADPRSTASSYYLIGPGRPELESRINHRADWQLRLRRSLDRHLLGLYLSAILLLTILFSFLVLGCAGSPWRGVWLGGAILAVTLAVSRSAVSVVNWLATLLVPPQSMLRFDFSEGLPPEHRTAVVVPTFLTSLTALPRLLEQMEIRFLANRSPNLLMVLLTDFPDAVTESLPTDQPLLEAALAAIRRLNRKYAENGAPVFYLLHRPRQWNPAEACWMGYERKRGKVEQFNRLVLDGITSPFALLEGDLPLLRGVQHVIVLDADTILPPQSAWKMVGAMAHPLNRPQLDSRRHCVIQGFGILQPRLAVNLKSAQRSRFARLFAGDVGLDPYSREDSNVYQDLFGEGQFVGKGIYDVRAFAAAAGDLFPENRILSHDLIEGGHARCGFLNDVELLEDHPARYLADVSRRCRWARGDWQIARWLLPRVPGPGGTRGPNPLHPLTRWMILDNLRRTLLPLAWLAALVLGWVAFPAQAFRWTALLLAVFMLSDMLRLLRALVCKSRSLGWLRHWRETLRRETRPWAIAVLELLLIPFQAFMYVREILRTGWRLWVSRRRLLEWQTASDAENNARSSLAGTYSAMWFAPTVAVVAAVLLLVAKSPALTAVWPLPESLLRQPLEWTGWLAVGPFLIGWFLSPALVWILSRPAARRASRLAPDQRLFLRQIARRTWAFFERFTNLENHCLPPDNFQENPPIGEAPRTSPTNIGMALLSNLAACDFGYISVGMLLRRTGDTFTTLEELPRHRGHFYNWYDTRTLQPIHPRYISTADSGNFAGSLLTLQAGLAEFPEHSLLPGNWREGLDDTARILLQELAADDAPAPADRSARQRVHETVVAQMAALGSAPATLPGVYQALSALTLALAPLESLFPPADSPAHWLHLLRSQAEDLRTDLAYLVPWLDRPPTRDGNRPAFLSWERIPTLRELAAVRQAFVWTETKPASAAGPTPAPPDDLFLLAEERAGQRLAALADLQTRCAELYEMELGFLYDTTRNLLAIGYNLETHQRDPGHYDLLASEARLCSFLGVVRGQLPIEHWFHLGRQLAPDSRTAALVSWSGSMFEYLMPLLFMPTYETTLLHQSCREAVRRQIGHGHHHGIPWGISESCYNQLDLQQTYQYRAFGVPGLGLKRGLDDDLVIAPYATALALMLEPRAACRNLQAMADRGFVGRYGFYESADYTPARIPRGEKFALVRTYMAHHSGMSLLALASALLEAPMQRRFLSDPRIRAYQLLLQERIPVAEVRTQISLAPEKLERTEAVQPPIAQRIFTRTDSPVPDVHLLSNGRYHVLISSAGSGFSRWENLALTRWREDAVRDHWGTFFYLRDLDDASVWSVTAQPTGAAFDRYEVIFAQGVAEFLSVRDKLEVRTRVAVSPEDDVELRRLVITNLSGHSRNLELTSYAEVTLLNGLDAGEQPAFQGLFVETRIVPEKAAILSFRRSKSPEENWPCFFHGLVTHETPAEQEVSFETDRGCFMGRGRTSADPAALKQSGPLSGTAGAVLDPVLAIRRPLHLGPGKSVVVDAVWGVGPDRDKALTLVDKYYDHNLADRVFDLAWTHSQIRLHQFQVTEEDAQLFTRMAGYLVYAHPRLRARASLIARNRKGQPSLWAYGISGDLPITLLRISDQSGLDLVRQMIQAHAYWRSKGLRSDLVILAEAYAGYRQTLLDAIIGLINAGPEARALDQPAGIFVRNVDQVPEDDRLLLQAVSRIVLSDRGGALNEQLERLSLAELDIPLFKPTRDPENPELERSELLPRDLLFFNGWGGFTPDGREYVIPLHPGSVTPAPWVNVLANPNFGSVISESGGAYTWYQNAHEFRLTPWYNDPVSDVSGEAFYLRDEESGRFWSPLPGPARGRTPYLARHGLGYSAFEHQEERISSEVFTYVAREAPLKFIALTLRNRSNRKRRLSVTGYVEWVLAESRERHGMHVVTRLDPQSGALFASNAFRPDFAGTLAFFHCSHPQRTLCTRRLEFLGRNGSLAAPAALGRARLSNRISAGVDPCAAIQAYVEIPPGEQTQVVFVLGAADSEQQARSLLAQWGGVDGARHALEEVWEFWKRSLGGIYVDTPDPSVNLLVNHWLLYQTLACRFWGRSGYYQSGGAYGFRDQLQDSLAFLYECPWLTRQHLLTSSARQFQNGDVQHWWHPPSGRGVRTRIADDFLWLPYVTARYIAVTGDTGVLDEQTPFLEAPPLDPAEESRYGLPQISDRRATLYEHCVRALERGLRTGAHGLPLMGSGDWNDGMNRVGREGRGESVWLAFFLYDTLQRFATLAQKHDDANYAQKCRAEAERLREKIEANAWDGRWYLRAFFDDGSPLGSAANPQCQIDLLPQAWAVLSAAGRPERAAPALQVALERLVDPALRLIRLFDPPFDGTVMDPGYIRGYVPGVRENGGQYTHAAIWAVKAAARLGDADLAWRLFGLLNPIRHGDTPERAQIYKVEPYVVAADVYSVPGHEGRGGWTWYTGSAGWMYQVLIEDLLGLRVEVDTLSLSPLLPADWDGYTLHYRYRNTFYHIRIVKKAGVPSAIARVWLDDVEQLDAQIHLVDDQREHHAVVEVLPGSGPRGPLPVTVPADPAAQAPGSL